MSITTFTNRRRRWSVICFIISIRARRFWVASGSGGVQAGLLWGPALGTWGNLKTVEHCGTHQCCLLPSLFKGCQAFIKDPESICHSSPLGADWRRLYISAPCIHPDRQHLNLHLHACANCLSDLCSLNVSEVKWWQIYTDSDPPGRVALFQPCCHR